MESPLDALMMDFPLTLTHFFERSRRLFGGKMLATRIPGQPLFRYTYADFAARTMRLGNVLGDLGLRRGDRVATLAWNSHRHLELYWAVPLSGYVLHTLNLRLSTQDLAYIANHAGDRVIFADASLLPILAGLRDRIPTVTRIVVMPDTPDFSLPPGADDYEALLAAAHPLSAWPALEERWAAAMCYTSGTTGHPKGVVYTHRALFLHCMAMAMTDLFALSESDVILHIVPMFHANAWCVPHTGVMVGAAQIFAGPNPQPRDICELVQSEKVTFTGAVPTVWIAVKELIEKEGYDLSSLRCVPCGGSAAPKSLIEYYEKALGVPLVHAWGMTETSPIGTIGRLKSYMQGWPDEQRYAARAKQGYVAAGVELRIVGEDGTELPCDGRSMGEIQVRGPWVVGAYYDNPESAARFTEDGWFKTGDVATLDGEGYLHITDRTKDLIKSGGEWISSVDVENMIMAHPQRCWALPDEVVFLEGVPKTSVGKFDKKVLRERFKDWSPPAERSS